MPSFALKEVRPGQGLLGAAGNFKAQPSRAAVSLEGTAMSARAGRPPGCTGYFSGLPPSARWNKAHPEQRGLPGPGRLWPRPLAPQGWWPRDCQDGGAWGEGLGVAPPPRESCPSCFRPPWGPVGRGAEDMFASARGGLPKVWNCLSKEQFLFFFRPPTVAHGSSQASG